MGHQARRAHGSGADGGPEQGLLGLSEDVLARIVLFFSADDACRLKSLNRKLDVSLSKLVCFGQHHRLPVKPRGLHWWSCLERRTRSCDAALALDAVPALAAAFGIKLTSCTPLDAQQQQTSSDSNYDNDNEEQEEANIAEEQHEDVARGTEECGLQVLTAAALFGSWWGPTAEPNAEQGCRQAVKLLELCLGSKTAQAVQEMVRSAACPAAAHGFWGTLLLGFLASTTSSAAAAGGAKLTQLLLRMAARAASSSHASDNSSSGVSRHSSKGKHSSSQWRKVPVPIPDTTPWQQTDEASDPAPAPEADNAATEHKHLRDSDSEECADISISAAAGAHSHWLPLASDASASCLRYHVNEFLSALLVLLRLAPLRRSALLETAALQELHYSVLQEVLLQEAYEQDAAAAALVGMPGQQQQQLSIRQLAQAAGLPDGCMLTGEQLKVVRSVVAGASSSSNSLVLINAFAGTAKSTTLKLLMHANQGTAFLYTAYNKAVVEDAKASAPSHVDCKTTHQLAGPKRIEMKDRPRWQLGAGFVVGEMWSRLAEIPYYKQRIAAGGKGPPRQVAAAVKETLDKFMTSADRWVGLQHLPKVLDPLSDPPDYVQVAQQMWQAIVDNTCSPMKFSHNCYLKQFSDALVDRRGTLRNWRGQPYQVILIDEAQDVNAVTLQFLLSQPCLVVLVGDRHQHIYSFNYCANALAVAPAAAAAAGRPKRVSCYSLSSSFRLGPAVAAVANRLLWQLGERKRPLVGVGWQHAAVYSLMAAADNGADGTAEQTAAGRRFEQVQLLQQQTTTDRTPDMLEALTLLVEARDGPQQLRLALPPANPATGKRRPLWYITRYNKTWVEAAAALVLPERQLGGGFSSPAAATPSSSRLPGTPGTGMRNNGGAAAALDMAGGGGSSSSSRRRNLFGVPIAAAAGARGQQAVLEQENQHAQQQQQQQQQHGLLYGSQFSSSPGSNNGLLAGSPYSSRVASQSSTPQQQPRYAVPKLFLTAVDGNSGRVEFLENVLGIYKLKYQGTRFRQYSSWSDLEAAAERREDADLLGAIGLVRKYQQRTQQLVQAIQAAKVTSKADADFILGTCHKAKGCEEDYVQLADDFAPIRAGRQPGVEDDEYNLLYVAATRAKVALVVNPDLEQLLLSGIHRPLLLQADGADAAPPGQAGSHHTAATHCSCCSKAISRPAGTANASAAAANGSDGVTRLLIAVVPGPLQLHMPVMFGAEQAEPGLAAGAMQQEQQWQAMLQQQLQPVCADCLRAHTIWGQLAG